MFTASVVFTTCLTLIVSCQAAERWIIDTDAGADDAVALFTFLAIESKQENVEIIGITAVHGNTHVDNVCRNVLKVLDTANRLDIPVFKGANQSILNTPPGDNFFGEDGFGDFEYPNPPSEDYIRDTHAVNYLTEIVKTHPGEINLLSIGPLTNIAMAIRMDPNFFPRLKSFHILGGSIQAIGNVRPGIEFNFFIDPEANFIVLDEAIKNEKIIKLLSWETALTAGISKEWRKNVFGSIASPVVDILNKAENVSLASEDLWIPSDMYVVLWAIDPNFPVTTTTVSGKIETCGTLTRGAIVIDYLKSEQDYNQIALASPESLNVTYIEDKLLDVFAGYRPIL